MRGPARTTVLPALLLAVLVLLTACGGYGGSSGSGGSGGPGGSGSGAGATTIVIKGFGFTGGTGVKAGQTVTVRNEDAVAHTVTADQGHAFDVTVGPGRTARFTAPGKAGSYPYHCTFHPDMHGRLTVS